MIWVKVFKNGPSNICGRQPFVEDCLPQILLGPFSNTLNYMYVNVIYETITFKNGMKSCIFNTAFRFRWHQVSDNKRANSQNHGTKKKIRLKH